MGRIFYVLIGVLLIVSFSFNISQADLVDNFDGYATGTLSSVSGGVWRIWNNGTNDAQVVLDGLSAPNALSFDNTYGDVVSYSTQDLFLNGATATFSFDFFVPSGNVNIVSSLILGSGNPSDNTINYGSEVTEIVIGYGTINNLVGINLYGYNFPLFPQLTTVSLDKWHNLSLVAQQTGSSGSFNIYIDNILVANNYSFPLLSDPYGMNAIEIYSSNIEQLAGTGYYKYDNISLTSAAPVPEPATMFLLGSGLIGLAGYGRKKFFKK